MLVPKNSPSIARIISIGLPVFALAIGGCNRDDLAPDCFKIDPESGVCLIPDPGGTAPGINCETMPTAAVGATYSFTPAVGGGSGNFTQWSATGLPPTLTIDPNTGEISGVPEEQNAYASVEISMFDAGKGQQFSATCGELVVNPALNSDAVRLDEDDWCLDINTSYEEMVDTLENLQPDGTFNGDGTEITCSALNPSDSATCPLGDGNGRLPPGISFNESSCTHSGSIEGDRRGTWVWMVEVTQSGYSTTVPFCATNGDNDVDSFHDIMVTANGETVSDLLPGLYEYDPDASLTFGSGSYTWQIYDPACPGPDCSSYGFRFNVSCSPFDVEDPWQITLSPSMGTETGLMHEMTATGPTPDPEFSRRPFTTSFEISYCTSADGAFCDTTDGEQFEANAQTKYHFSVVGYPTQP